MTTLPSYLFNSRTWVYSCPTEGSRDSSVYTIENNKISINPDDRTSFLFVNEVLETLSVYPDTKIRV